ncbi:MAG: hypothetical protein Q7S96_04485 [bacterium]|nr:hypothetical protein [bacterium]
MAAAAATVIVGGIAALLLTITQQGEEEDAAFLRAQNAVLMEQIAKIEQMKDDQSVELEQLRRGYGELIEVAASEIGSIDALFKSVARKQRATVERFFDLVLPPDPLDYDAATYLLAGDLAEQLRADISWVPRTLGIQDSPDRIAVLDLEGYFGIFGARVAGYYGDANEPERIWRVSGIFEERPTFEPGTWVITDIAVLR